MMTTWMILLFTALCSFACAGVRSGQAKVDWISTSNTYEAGKPVQMGIRLVIDPGWHSYWSNPGEGGMKTSVKWEIPPGWTAGELEHPLPERFNGGGLAGFGYEGTVIFPVKITPSINSNSAVRLKAKITWLTCNDQSCIPGSAELEFELSNGKDEVTPEAKLIEQALTKVPREQKQWGPLEVTEKNGQLEFKIPVNDDLKTSPVAKVEILPLTPNIIDADEKIELTFNDNKWIGAVTKSEYANSPIREISLVVDLKTKQPPVLLHWKID